MTSQCTTVDQVIIVFSFHAPIGKVDRPVIACVEQKMSKQILGLVSFPGDRWRLARPLRWLATRFARLACRSLSWAPGETSSQRCLDLMKQIFADRCREVAFDRFADRLPPAI